MVCFGRYETFTKLLGNTLAMGEFYFSGELSVYIIDYRFLDYFSYFEKIKGAYETTLLSV
jgi:hypothetical protein